MSHRPMLSISNLSAVLEKKNLWAYPLRNILGFRLRDRLSETQVYIGISYFQGRGWEMPFETRHQSVQEPRLNNKGSQLPEG